MAETTDTLRQLLQPLLQPYLELPLECDGLTRVLSYVLDQHAIDHQKCIGILIGHKGPVVHWWIRLPDNSYIDYRAKMWQGDTVDIPAGIFDANQYPAVNYELHSIDTQPTSKLVFELLTTGLEFSKR